MKLFVCLGCLSVVLFGCKDDPAPSANQSASRQDGEEPSEGEAKPDSTGGLPYKLNLKKPGDEEIWLLYICRDQAEFPIGMVHLKKNGEQYAINVGAIPPQTEELTLTEGSATDETVSLLIRGKSMAYSFRGKLRDGIIWGNSILETGQCVPSRLVRPGEMLEEPPEPSPFEGKADFQKLLQNDPDWNSLQAFIEQHPQSPYVINAFYGLLVQCGPRQMSNEDLDALFELLDRSTELWGERMQESLRMNAILQISNYYSYPEFMSRQLATVDGVPNDKIWDEILTRMKEGVPDKIDLARRIEEIPQLEPEARSETLQQLSKDIGSHRFDPFLLAKLGDVLTAAGDLAAAAESYAQLVSIPGLESQYLQVIGSYREKLGTVSDRLESVWKQAHHDDLSGLNEYKLQSYERFIENFEVDLAGISFDSESPNLVVELFTGSACAPCIAADIACSILSRKLPPEHVTVLQYHLHSPGPDPFTNPDSEARFFFYSGSGTPATFLNGRALNSMGGPPSSIPGGVNSLLDEIRKELSLKTPLQIELTGNRSEKNQLSCRANVVSDSVSSRWRLMVVLAEEEIHFTGQNGIPIHEMVVRKILTPPLGIEPQAATLTWNGSIDLDQLRTDLDAFLSKDEEEHNYKFPEKPLALKGLHLVAFVQDQQNNRIRQVQSIPVPSATDSTGSGDN